MELVQCMPFAARLKCRSRPGGLSWDSEQIQCAGGVHWIPVTLPGMREQCNLCPFQMQQGEGRVATCSGTFSNPKFMITLDHMKIDEGNDSYQDSKVGQQCNGSTRPKGFSIGSNPICLLKEIGRISTAFNSWKRGSWCLSCLNEDAVEDSDK